MEEIRYNVFISIINHDPQNYFYYFEKNIIDINESLNGYDWTPLHTAAYVGDLELASYLIEKGANKSQCNKSGLTPLKIA